MVVERSCTRTPLAASFKKHIKNIIDRPRCFVISRPARLVFALYLGTFTAANAACTLSASSTSDPPTTRTAATLAALFVNVPIGIYKDTVFSQLFGCAVMPRAVSDSSAPILPRTPPSTFVAFLVRDAVTIYTSFALPGLISAYVPDAIFSGSQSKAALAQVIVPALGQVLNTPIHIVGLEVYNKQSLAKGSEIVSVIRRDFITSAITRMCRIIPAFGLGTLTNNEIRDAFRVGTRVELNK